MKTADNRCRQESKRKKLATQEPVVVTFNISNRCRCECSWNFNWIWSPNSQKLYIFPFPYNPPRPSSPPSILRSLVHTRIASSIFAASLPPMCGCFLDAFAFGFHFILLFVFCGIFFNTRKTSYVHANYWSITKRTIHPAVEQPIHYHEYIWYVTNNDVNFHLDFFFFIPILAASLPYINVCTAFCYSFFFLFSSACAVFFFVGCFFSIEYTQQLYIDIVRLFVLFFVSTCWYNVFRTKPRQKVHFYMCGWVVVAGVVVSLGCVLTFLG